MTQSGPHSGVGAPGAQVGLAGVSQGFQRVSWVPATRAAVHASSHPEAATALGNRNCHAELHRTSLCTPCRLMALAGPSRMHAWLTMHGSP